MARSRYKIYEEEYPYFITSSINCGLPVFGIPELAEIVLQSLKFLREQRQIKVLAYVIMEDHMHAVIQGKDLATKTGSFKSFTARQIIDRLQKMRRKRILRQLKLMKIPHKIDQDYQMWQEGFHPKQIIGDDMLIQKIEYIHMNPVMRGYVNKPEHWRYSSARNYSGMSGLIEVDMYKGRGAF